MEPFSFCKIDYMTLFCPHFSPFLTERDQVFWTHLDMKYSISFIISKSSSAMSPKQNQSEMFNHFWKNSSSCNNALLSAWHKVIPYIRKSKRQSVRGLAMIMKNAAPKDLKLTRRKLMGVHTIKFVFLLEHKRTKQTNRSINPLFTCARFRLSRCRWPFWDSILRVLLASASRWRRRGWLWRGRPRWRSEGQLAAPRSRSTRRRRSSLKRRRRRCWVEREAPERGFRLVRL